MFHLNFNPTVSSEKINHQQNLLFIGSCFSEHISDQLSNLKFSIDSNPFGIVFNPHSIYSIVLNCIHNTEIDELRYVERDGNWFCLDAHSGMYASEKNELQRILKNTIFQWHHKLKSADWLIITLGSAFAYEYKQTTEIVSNCHKLPAHLFSKKLLSTQQIVSDYDALIEKLKLWNPNLKIIFTVSPVKHLRDGVIENNLSKSILIQSVHDIISKHLNCFYFPAYELVLDDLRDYRFYESDMAHPNSQAVKYVFDKFMDVYFSDETKLINKQLTEINTAFNHKPFNNESLMHETFKQNMVLKCEQIVNQFPFLDLTKELNYFKPAT